ncbi:hypothetical protein GQ607_001674, partial [Colletotrichum asianum]
PNYAGWLGEFYAAPYRQSFAQQHTCSSQSSKETGMRQTLVLVSPSFSPTPSHKLRLQEARCVAAAEQRFSPPDILSDMISTLEVSERSVAQ